jgi:hypothetical protein
VEGEVVAEVAVAVEGAEPQDGFGAVKAPPGSMPAADLATLRASVTAADGR